LSKHLSINNQSYKIIHQYNKGKFSKTHVVADYKNNFWIAKVASSSNYARLLHNEYDILFNYFKIKEISLHTSKTHTTLIKPFIKGESLEKFVYKKQLDRETVFSIISQISEQLSVLHTNGYIHHDIKPTNIIYDKSSGKATLIDFANAINLKLKPKNNFPFTLFYAPQESVLQFGSLLNFSTDTYALSMLMLNLLNGDMAVAKNNPVYSLHQQICYGYTSQKKFSEKLNDFFVRGLSHYVFPKPPHYYSLIAQKRFIKSEQEKRFQTITDFNNALKDILR
jgi:serine/threonine protein kinase